MPDEIFPARVKFKRRTTAQWALSNPVLLAGEPGIEVLTDGTEKIKYGDGVKTWSLLSYAAGGGGGGPALSNAAPQGLGATASAGTAATASRSDHVHARPTAGEVGADAAGTAAAVVAAHAAAADPHPGYLTPAEGDAAYVLLNDSRLSNSRTPTAHKSSHATDGSDALSPGDIGAAAVAHGHAIADVTGLQTALDGKVGTSDVRLGDSREWSANTILQAEAEAGISTTRRAFTAQRVFQAIAAWWNGVATAQGQALVGSASYSAMRTLLGLGSAATASTTDFATAAQGTDQRVPTDGSVTDAKIFAGGLAAGSINWVQIAAWQASTAYAKGDLVEYLGIAYRRTMAGTSGASFVATNWQQITPSSPPAHTQAASTITGLATVATSGAYGDLSGQPTLGSAASRDAGTASGNVPILDDNALIPSALLPGFVDDVVEFNNVAAFPATGETGKLYVSLATNRIYRWSGSIYVEINPSPGSTDAVPEGSVNLYYTSARGQSAASSWWAGYRSSIGDQLATAASQSAARGFIGAGTSSVIVSSTAPAALGASASAGTSADAARADHVHARSTYADLGAIGDGLILVVSNKGETATAGTNYAEVPVPVPSGSFTLTAVRFGCHIDNTGSSSSIFNAYRRTAAGTKTSVLTGNATLASAASLVDASSTITGGTFNAGDRIGVDLVGVGTGAQGLFAQFIFTRSAT